jgi:hypothetical protein
VCVDDPVDKLTQLPCIQIDPLQVLCLWGNGQLHPALVTPIVSPPWTATHEMTDTSTDWLSKSAASEIFWFLEEGMSW